MFAYGLLYGFTWRRVRESRLFGILLYPYIAHIILFWFGTNAVFEAITAALVMDSIILSAYEFLFVNKSKAVVLISPVG